MPEVQSSSELILGRSSACPFDPPEELAALRAEQPLRRMVYPNGHRGWLATGRAQVRAVFADARFSIQPVLANMPHLDVPVGIAPPPPAGAFTDLDPPEHARYRGVVAKEFTARRMRLLTERLEQIAAEQLDAMERSGPPADLVDSFAQPIPARMICELLGVPYADRERFQAQAIVLTSSTVGPEEMTTAWVEIQEHIQAMVEAKRAKPTDDLLSGLANSTEHDLTDEELVNIGIVLLGGGLDTTANMLAMGTFALLGHPEQYAMLSKGSVNAERAVDELLRYLAVIPMTVRTALEDVEIDGQTIKAGESVTLAIGAANRDPEVFEHPDVLDLQRHAASHVSFGHGIHHCIGHQLARVEMKVAFPALAARLPGLRLAVPPEEVPVRSGALIYGADRLPVTW